MNILGIEEDVLLDQNYIKVIDGIAGSAKSSNLHTFFNARNIEYGRYTSTNRLKRDAASRFGMEVKTVASGLFNTESGIFYKTFKAPDHENIVIDEVLQTSVRVFEWCSEFVGQCNIIICTDSRQTLAPEQEKQMTAAYDSFCRRPDVVFSRQNKSFRPRTKKTDALYQLAYMGVKEEVNMFRSIPHSEGELPDEFDESATYICHTNDIEEYLYDKYDLYSRYDLELIGKSFIASKSPSDTEKYPILPQNKASRNRSLGYWQVSNIATATRYQGSEVHSGHTLYWIVNPDSVVSNREYYTVITRCWDVDDIVVVTIDRRDIAAPKQFHGKPILEWALGIMTGEIRTPGDYTVQDLIDKANGEADLGVIEYITAQMPKGKNVAYRTDSFLYNGHVVKSKAPEKTNGKTMPSLLRKEGVFTYSYMPQIYRTIDRKDLPIELITGPFFSTRERGKFREMYQYGIDLKAAYPHILKYALLPTCNRCEEQPFEGSMDLYYVKGGYTLKYMSIVTSEVIAAIPEEEYGYLCSVSCQEGSKMGDWLHEMAHRSVESKQKIKEVHYGYAERQYIHEYDRDENGTISYVCNPKDNHALLMVAIRSELVRIMAEIKRTVYGDLQHGEINVDCLYFDYEGDITELGDRLNDLIAPYDFRIFRNESEKEKLYQNYEELMTEAELKKARRRR